MLIEAIIFHDLFLPIYDFISLIYISCLKCFCCFIFKFIYFLFESTWLCSNFDRPGKNDVKRKRVSVCYVVKLWCFFVCAHVFFTFRSLGKCFWESFFEILGIIPWRFAHRTNGLVLALTGAFVKRVRWIGGE